MRTPVQTGRFPDRTVRHALYPLFDVMAHIGLRLVEVQVSSQIVR
ncbi:hypothetical protein [Amycolatopsis sp. NPDC054798]